MVEANVIDEIREWNAVDIFIFSNGQQSSPPRKYHLCSDDLKFWESTISFLAHSQYGSLNSKIELYTTEGRKVDGPLQLSNDAAYVAVTPPDPFIQSGYEKYLLKASRSWEKRQEKKLSVVSTTPEDKIHVNGNKEISSSNNNKLGTDHSQIPAEKEKVRRNSTNKLPSTLLKPLTKSPTTSKDPIEKRKLLSTKTILRKINKSGKLSDNLKSESSDLKKIGVISKSVIKQSITPKATPIIDAILETESSQSTKKDTPTQNEDTVNATEIKHGGFYDKRSSIVLDTIIEPKNYINKTIINENNNVYKNSESETTSVFVDADKDINDEIINKIPATCNEIKNSVFNIVINEQSTNREENSKKKTFQNAIISETVGTQKSNHSINEKPQQTQTKECIFNLNLNIEVKDYKPLQGIENEVVSKCFNLKSADESLTSVKTKLDKEKERIQTENRYINTVNVTKPINGNGSCQNFDNTKVIVVKCSCSSHQFDDKTFILQCKGNPRDYFIFVPTQEIFKPGSIYKWSNAKPDNTDKKVNDMGTNAIPNVDNANSLTEDLIKNVSLNSKTDVVKEHRVSISISDPTLKDCSSKTSLKKVNVSTETAMENDNKLWCVGIRSVNTQTEWCDVLVEARCNQTGNYTFHLPSLETLKQYKL